MLQNNLAAGGAMPVFSMKAIQNNFKSQQENRPVFEDVEWVDVFIPGDRNTQFSAKATNEHKERWPEHYRAFKDKMQAPKAGYPVEEWALLTRSKVEELKLRNIRTLEDLIAMPDTFLGMGERELRAKAKAFLDQSKDSMDVQKLVDENMSLKEDIEILKRTVADMQRAMGKPVSLTADEPAAAETSVTNTPTKRRGRPAKKVE